MCVTQYELYTVVTNQNLIVTVNLVTSGNGNISSLLVTEVFSKLLRVCWLQT